jgi:galactose mutarotase-like enzyme
VSSEGFTRSLPGFFGTKERERTSTLFGIRETSGTGTFARTIEMSASTQPVELKDLKNDVCVLIDPAFGGEVRSFAFRGQELLWSSKGGKDWRGGCPVLFPAVGRQKDGRYSLGKAGDVTMPLHGFVLDKGDGTPQAFKVEAHKTSISTADDEEDEVRGGSHVTLTLDSSALQGLAKEKGIYPFSFSLSITYALRNGLMIATHKVKRNVGSIGPSHAPATVPMPVAIGNHATFGVGSGEAWSAACLKGSTFIQHGLNTENLLSGETEVIKELENSWTPLDGSGAGPGSSGAVKVPAGIAKGGLPLTFPIATNAVFGLPGAKSSQAEAANAPCAMQLILPSKGIVIEVSQQVSPITRSDEVTRSVEDSPSVPAAGAAGGETNGSGEGRPGWEEISANRLFVTWGDESKGFICVEPWLTGPDSLNTHKGLPMLYPGEEVSWSYAIKVAEISK